MTRAGRLLPPRRRTLEPDVSFAVVNIVLLLILFFLATGAIVNTPNLGVNISETETLPIEQLPRPVLSVEPGPGGAVELDGVPIARADLAAALAGQRVLHVLIDRDAPARDLLDLLAEPGLGQLEVRLVTAHHEAGP